MLAPLALLGALVGAPGGASLALLGEALVAVSAVLAISREAGARSSAALAGDSLQP